MIATVWHPGTAERPVGARMSGETLRREAAGLTANGGYAHGWRVGTRHGLPALRCRDRYAEDVREAYRALRRWASATGYIVRLDCNAAETRALYAGRYVDSTSGRYTMGRDTR